MLGKSSTVKLASIGGPSEESSASSFQPIVRPTRSTTVTLPHTPYGESLPWRERHSISPTAVAQDGSSSVTPRNSSNIQDKTYDFVMSSHVIEHIANPIRALKEWHRVVRPGGAGIFVVPHLNFTFDHHRPLTTLQHMLDDFAQSTTDDDQLIFKKRLTSSTIP